MPNCPKCQRFCKTAQGLSGHIRFRHQMTVPKQDLPVYAKDRLEKAEDENAKLREQVARLQRQHQDQGTLYEKRMAEQKIELERAQERKLAEQQGAAALKQHEEQIRSERARVEKEAIAALSKQIQDLQKKAYELGDSTSESEKARQDLMRERDRTRGPSFLPPLPHPLHPVSSLRKIERWFFE